ncbi:phage tail assembly protein [Thermosulfuriphilus sp.]
MPLQTEFEFTLPKGYIDENGEVHRQGIMRLATAADEILPLKDPRVQNNPAYLSIIVLSRVVTRLGSLPEVNPRIIEGLFLEDLLYLQDLYRRLNGGGQYQIKSRCPQCGAEVEVSLLAPGE